MVTSALGRDECGQLALGGKARGRGKGFWVARVVESLRGSGTDARKAHQFVPVCEKNTHPNRPVDRYKIMLDDRTRLNHTFLTVAGNLKVGVEDADGRW